MKALIISMYLLLLSNSEVILDGFGFKVLLPISNKDYSYSFDNHTEGVFYNFIFNDRSAIVVECSSNIVKPLMNINIIKSDTILINGMIVFRNHGFEKDKLHFWQENIYDKIDLSVRVRNASSENFEAYEKLLEDIKIIK